MTAEREPGTDTVMVGGVLHWSSGDWRERVLSIYLTHLKALAVPPRYDRVFGFILDECPPGAGLQILRYLQQPCSFVTTNLWQTKHMPEERGKRKATDRYEHMAFVRNLLADLAVQSGASHLLSVDGDVAVHPSTLGVLLGTGRPQASVLVQNTPPPEEPWAWNVLSFTVDGMRCTHIEPHAAGGLCDATGAACLYECETLQNVRFYADPQGEDVGFARAARLWGGKLFKAAYVPCGAQHLMIPDQYDTHVQDCPICHGFKPSEFKGRVVPLHQKVDSTPPEGLDNPSA